MYAHGGLFGLPRKKSARERFPSPLHGRLFFCDQSDVDEFVDGSCGQKELFKVSL